MRARSAALLAATAVLGTAATAVADGPAPPPPCTGSPQITDATGDGHHTTSDVLAAWLTEGAGHLQAVIQVRVGAFVPEHSDAQLNGSGFALLYGSGSYVRARAAPDGSLTYDYGTFAGSTFTTLGATTGSVVHSAGAGTVTIDVPAPPATITDPYVLTYDGINAGVPDWVDHAPGGDTADDPARGADYVLGSCVAATAPGPGGAPAATSAVQLAAPKRITGGGRVLVSGTVVPARGGVPVTITHGKTSRLTTDDDGSFAFYITVRETTRVRASAAGLSSNTLTVAVRSRTRMKLSRGVLRGTVAPALPGRVLLLRSGSPDVVATRKVAHGAFTFRGHFRGAYQAVYVPSGERAERSTSNTVRVKEHSA